MRLRQAEENPYDEPFMVARQPEAAGEDKRSRVALNQSARVAPLVGMATLLVNLVVLCINLYLFLSVSGMPQKNNYLSLRLDPTQLPKCPQPPPDSFEKRLAALPCRRGRTVTVNEGSIGPWRPLAGGNGALQLRGNNILVMTDCLLQVSAHITYYDSHPHPIRIGITLNGQLQLQCLLLTSEKGYSFCSISNGLLQLKAGDEIGLKSLEAFREVHAGNESTYLTAICR